MKARSVLGVASIFVALVAMPLLGGADPTPGAGVLDDEEGRVIAAAIKQLHLAAASQWFMLAERTITFACESASDSGFAVGDCSGMRNRDQTPDQVLNWVRKTIPSVTKELTDSLSVRASSPARIGKPIPLNFRQVIWSPKGGGSVPKDLGTPDFAAYPSRVAFNANRNTALFYLGVVNWSDSSKSFGEYLYLTKVGGEWLVKGRARVWQLGG